MRLSALSPSSAWTIEIICEASYPDTTGLKESGERLELKRARLSHHHFSKQLRTNLFYYQSSGKYFLPSDPLRETSVPSGLSMLRLSAQYRLLSSLNVAAKLEQVNRHTDSLSQNYQLFGLRYSTLTNKRLSISAIFGPKKSFQSSGLLAQFQVRYFKSSVNLFLQHQLIQGTETVGKQSRDSSDTSMGLDWFISQKIALNSYFSMNQSLKHESLTFYLGGSLQGSVGKALLPIGNVPPHLRVCRDELTH